MPLLRFGAFSFDSGARLLRQSGRPVHLTAKATDLLAVLVSRHPDAVSKKAIHAELWPDTFVSDVSLTTLIFELRSALGESARHPQFIRTVHGFGYAFQADEVAPDNAVTSRFHIIYDNREIALRDGENLVGRARECQVRIDSTRVSRKHACIMVDGHSVSIEDRGSRNGTWVGGQRTAGRVRLNDGDEIGIAGIRLIFRVMQTTHGTEATQ